MLSVKFRKIGGFDLTPILSGFLATVVSGGIFVTILWSIGLTRQCIYVWYVADGSYRRRFERCHYANLVHSGTTSILQTRNVAKYRSIDI